MRAAAVALLFAASLAGADENVDPDAPSLTLLARQGAAREVALVPKVKIGEPFQVVINATAKAEVLVNLPASFDAGDFEVTERKETASPDGTEKHFELTVVGWKPGHVTLPGIPVTYVPKGKGEVKQVKTAPLDVEVEAVLADPEKADLRPLAPPVDVMVKDWTLVYVVGAVGGALLLGGGTLLLGRLVARRRKRRTPEPEAVDLRPPHEVALAKLAELEKSGRLDDADRRPFYFAVTEIVREYLGRRFGFDALDMTSAELLAALERTAAEPAVRAEVEGWLAGCDLVKYARVPAQRDEAAAALASAIAMVEKLKPAAEESAQDGGPPAGEKSKLPPPPSEAARVG